MSILLSFFCNDGFACFIVPPRERGYREALPGQKTVTLRTEKSLDEPKRFAITALPGQKTVILSNYKYTTNSENEVTGTIFLRKQGAGGKYLHHSTAPSTALVCTGNLTQLNRREISEYLAINFQVLGNIFSSTWKYFFKYLEIFFQVLENFLPSTWKFLSKYLEIYRQCGSN